MDVSGYINRLEKKAAEHIKPAQGDYIGEDGLLYCGKCNTKKQTRIFFLGEERTPYCLCICEKEKKNKEKTMLKQAKFEMSAKKNRKICFSEAIMQSWTFENDNGSNEQIINAARKYVDNFETLHKKGKGLLLYGNVGSGKTYVAACIANALIDKGYPVLMTNFSRIANTVNGMYESKQKYLDDLNNYPLLILDDMCSERKTDYMQEIIYNVIDARYRSGLPLLVTTNLTDRELKNPNDISYQRIFSRLFEMCLPVKVESDDKRTDKLKDNLQFMKDLLEL